MSAHRPIEGTVTPKIVKRFVVKTERKDDGCLQWTAAYKENILSDEEELSEDQDPVTARYGVFRFNGRTVYAHRFALYMIMGEDPGPSVDHLCHNTLCVEPTHLRGGSIQENNANRRYITSEYCKNGHKRNQENTYWSPSGKRDCRPCAQVRDQKRYKDRYAREKETYTHSSEMRDFASEPKLSFEIAEEIRQRYAVGDTSQRKLAKEYQISQPMVGVIVRNKSWNNSPLLS